MIRQTPLEPIPAETEAAAKCFRRKPNLYVEFAKKFRESFDFSDFSDAYSKMGQSAIHPVRLLFLLMVQFIEGLSDRELMEELASRIDLKYLLALPMAHEGFDHTVLSEMRTRLINGNLESLLFDRILAFAEENKLLKTCIQRTDSTEILSAAKSLKRVELVIETLTHALDVLTDVNPKLVMLTARKFEQQRAYEMSVFQFRIPKKDIERIALAEAVGRDGLRLLAAIDKANGADVLNAIPAVEILRKVWEQQFDNERGGGKGPKFRKQTELAPSSELIASPHDVDARHATKRQETKFGYKAHVTETCSSGVPRLITNVLTTPATTSDSKALKKIERSLRSHGRKPSEHILDAGYTKAENMLNSREQFETETIGPLRGGDCWQSTADNGFDISNFEVDWENQKVKCPQGNESKSWRARPARRSVEISFNKTDCISCPVRSECTKSESDARKLEFKEKPLQTFLVAQREFQQSREFKQKYAARAGIEGTMARYHDVNNARSPYMSLLKTHFSNLMIAAGLNVVRIINHLVGLPLAHTRQRRFARFMALVAA